MNPRRTLASLAVCALLVSAACQDDSSTSPAPSASPDAAITVGDADVGEAGGEADGAPPVDGGADATADGNTDGGCAVTPPYRYAAGGSFAFRSSQDFRQTERFAQIMVGDSGVPLSVAKSARVGDDKLVVSSPDCKLCVVTPSSAQNGKISAELLSNAFEPRVLGETGDQQSVLMVDIVAGSELFSMFDLGSKTVTISSKLNIGGSGLACASRLIDVAGELHTELGGGGVYNLDVLADCNDGSGSGDKVTYLKTSGTFTTTAPFSSTATSHTVIARGGASPNRMEVSVGPIFVGGIQVYKVGTTQDFVLDTSLFQTCTLAGTWGTGAPVF